MEPRVRRVPLHVPLQQSFTFGERAGAISVGKHWSTDRYHPRGGGRHSIEVMTEQKWITMARAERIFPL